MIEYSLDEQAGVLHVHPLGPLAAADFNELAGCVDPYIDKAGDLRGLLLEIDRFPGWENFGAVAHHLRFVREHHRHIKKLAVVTDSVIGNLAENLADHFVAAEIRHFGSDALGAANDWLNANG